MRVTKAFIFLFVMVLLFTGCANTPTETSSVSATRYAEPTVTENITIGTWFEMPALSDITEDYENIQLCVTDTIRGEEAENLYKEYFARHHTDYISSLTNESLEYLVITYQISLPKDFPTEAGIPVPAVEFKPVNADGSSTFGDIQLISIGTDISDIVDIVKPGETSAEQQYICLVLKDSDYILKCTSGNTTKYITII